MIARVLLLIVAVTASANAGAAADPARYMDAKLVAVTPTPKPGGMSLVGFRFTPKPGWHGYWSNPGDSGIAPTVHWSAPDGVSFGPLLHPAPSLISTDGIDSFVHDGPHVLLARMTLDRSVPPGTAIPIKAELSWAACTATQCVPLRATLSLDLVAGDGRDGPSASMLRAAAAKVPRSTTGATFVLKGKHLRLMFPQSLNLDARRTRFFPDEGGFFDVGAARPSADHGGVVVIAPVKGNLPRSPGGVVSDGRKSYRVTFVPAEPSATIEEGKPAVQEPPPGVIAQVPAAPDSAIEASSKQSPEPPDDPGNSAGLWPLLALALPFAAAVWLWRRRR